MLRTNRMTGSTQWAVEIAEQRVGPLERRVLCGLPAAARDQGSRPTVGGGYALEAERPVSNSIYGYLTEPYGPRRGEPERGTH